MTQKFYVHRNTYLRRYDYEVILGKHLDVGTSIVVSDVDNLKRERTVTVSKITELGLMEAVRILPHDGMKIETKQVTIIPINSRIAYHRGFQDIREFKVSNRMHVHLSRDFIVTEVGIGNVILHFPAMFYNFLEIEVSDSNQFLTTIGGLFLHSENAI